MRDIRLVCLFVAVFGLSVHGLFGAQIVSELTHATCEELTLYKELRIYKDPSIFLPDLSLVYSDPKAGWENLLKENPLLTTAKGVIHLMRLSEPQEFKNFGAISKIYELADRKFIPKPTPSPSARGAKKDDGKLLGPKVIAVKVCNDAYSETMGFVLESDLKLAQNDERDDTSLPPSTRANSIPKLRKYPND